MKYNPALDGLRAIAVLMVMCFHAMTPRTSGGYLGGDVFFVLSGFLITSLLVAETNRTGTIQLKRFYKRRLARLTPALLLMLATYMVLAPFAWPRLSLSNDARDSLIALFYFSDYASAFWSIPDNLRHTWSLAVEEHFYLAWPAVVLLLHRVPSQKKRIAILGGMYIAFTLWRIKCDLSGGHSYDHTYYRFDTRLSGLTIGALLAFVLNTYQEKTPSLDFNFLAPVSFFILALCTWRFGIASTAAMTYGIIGVELASLVLIFVVVNTQNGWVYWLLSNRPVAFIGRMSYGLYLWHYPIFHYMWGQFSWYVTLLVGSGISLALAVISYYTVERFARQRFHAGRATQIAAQTA